ncbi:serine hydrolase domain-containing protein [Microbacterium sp.]|uniref:serine hydrolase domain-containing protein n=1 Tax=Microbacterium sp. TaxID=51671 RepID=UPI003F7205F2
MSERFSHAFDWARRTVAEGRLPTAVLGIATADGVVALDAFGATGDRVARTDDHFRLFSVTKPLTGLSAARAIERGLLSPETPLSTALPAFGAKRDDTVRLWHLASHTSGISEPALDSATPQRDDLLAAGPDFRAGTMSRYSTVAFEGIAALTEHATGRHWADDIADWAVPLGVDGLTLDEASDPHVVVGAAAAGLDIDRFAALRSPGAGLIGRAVDLLAIGAALLRDRGEIVQPATHAMMLRPLTGEIPRLEPYPAERGQDWGFTWNLRTRAPGLIDRDTYGHGGWSGAQFAIHPSAGVAYVLLTNLAQPDVDTDLLDNAVVSGL